MRKIGKLQAQEVCHRLDGLEEPRPKVGNVFSVCHRLDGLEGNCIARNTQHVVCHRLDGLEDRLAQF